MCEINSQTPQSLELLIIQRGNYQCGYYTHEHRHIVGLLEKVINDFSTFAVWIKLDGTNEIVCHRQSLNNKQFVCNLQFNRLRFGVCNSNMN